MRAETGGGRFLLAEPGPSGETAKALAEALLEVTGGHVRGILLFGSQLVGTAPSAHSAFDFVVVVDSYRGFYGALAGAGHHRRSPHFLAGLARVLPPNVVAFMPDLPEEPIAKCMVITGGDLERALGPRPPDHFLKGRLAQSVAVVHARDPRGLRWLEALVRDARGDVLRWAGPHLPDTFTAGELARRMLEVSYRGEVRPEARDRVREVFEAQEAELERMYSEVLEEERRCGRVERVGEGREGRYRLVDPPDGFDRLANRAYFLRSKLRATARWLKHVFTFDDWLTYIQRKVERRTGIRVQITPLERRFPFILLWPKVFRVLRSRPGGAADGEPPSDA